MFLTRQPTADDIHHYLREQRLEPLSYDAAGATNGQSTPTGYNRDRHVVELGRGAAVFERACEAIQNWEMFPSEMASLYWPSVEPMVGNEVVVGFRTGPLWSLNPCRVVYTIDEPAGISKSDHIARFGFAYGTLPGHVEKGEERFLVTWDRETDIVSYEISCFSKAQHWLALIGYPFVRYQQWRFRSLSGKTMQRLMRNVEADHSKWNTDSASRESFV